MQSGSNPGGGENYGWRVREGLIQNPYFPDAPPPPNAVDPILDLDHLTTAQCVIGGYFYHGHTVSDFQGLYVFGDCFGSETGNFSGRVFTLRYLYGVGSDFQDITAQLFPTKVGGFDLGALTSMGEDAVGELYPTEVSSRSRRI